MHLLENFTLALTALMVNKLRAFLTMLGIIIGISSVIAIVTVGNSLTASITSEMESMGANNVMVSLQQTDSEMEITDSGAMFMNERGGGMPTEEDLFTDEMIEEMKKEFSAEIKGVSLSQSMGSGEAKLSKNTANISLTGVNDGYFIANELTLSGGSLLGDREQNNAKKVAVVSDKLVEKLFGGNMLQAIGNSIDVFINDKFYQFVIIGIYEYKTDGMFFSMTSDSDTVTDIYIPLTTAKTLSHGQEGYSNFTVITNTGIDSDKFTTDAKRFFKPWYYNNQKFDVTAFSMASLISSLTTMLNTLSLAISVIAGISLLVGGIGVMNIMLVSVSERTREIGTRKALGASNGSIRIQFIVEAMTICLVGGIFGVISGIALGGLGAKLLGYAAKASVGSIIISLLFSMAIGVFFGYYPANRAAKMNPVDALRYE